MGGKGYKPRKDYAGRTVSGDWEDSDRGGGHKSIKRAGGEVEAKSPTYLAHVHNKGKKKVDPKKNPVVSETRAPINKPKAGESVGKLVKATADTVRGAAIVGGAALAAKKHADNKKVNGAMDEGYGTVVVQGTKQLGKLAVRQGIKVGGKAGGYAVKKAGKAAAKGAAEVARETGRGALEAAKKRGRKAGEDFVTNVGKQQVIPQTESVAAPAKKPVGKGEKVGKIVGSVAGGMAGGAAVGGPTLGVGALAGGVAGSVAGEKVGGAIGKGVDKVRSKFKKENFSDWRNELTEAERKLADRLARKRKLYDKTTRKAMDDAWRTGEASGHNRFNMSRLGDEMDKVKDKMKKKDVKEAKVDAGKSPEEKEKARNVRKFGVSHNVAGHGKLRRSLHKMNRGDKKIPGDKSKWMEMESLQLGEEGYDRMRDARLVKYGIGHDGSDRKGSTSRPTGKQPKGKTVLQKETEKKYGKGATALGIVKKDIEDKYGKGAMMDTKKK